MNSCGTILLLCSLLAVSPASGQTKLLTESVSHWLDSVTGKATSGDSTVYTYNSSNQIEKMTFWFFDYSDYVLTSRLKDFTYDANGNLLFYLFQGGNDINGWADDLRLTFTYNGNNKMLSRVIEWWDGMNWIILSSNTFTYDSNGNLLSDAEQAYQTFYTYNAQNLLEAKHEQELNNGIWDSTFRTEYNYSPNDTTVTKETRYAWFNDAWNNFRRIDYTYDVNGNLTQSLEAVWSNGIWRNDDLTTNTFDTNQKMTRSLIQSWQVSIWVNFSERNYTYDSDSDLVSSESALWLGTDWLKQHLSRNHYTFFVNSRNPALADFQIFPNPVNSVLILKNEGFAQARIFDSQGQLLRSQGLSGQAEETLRVGDLPAGNYILQVIARDGKIGAKPLQVRH